jgi:dipeptidyl-peptidase-4
MGLLGDNADGYKQSSAIANAPKLKGHLLLIHSLLDDNVHPQNTMQLLTALTNAGKDVDTRIYPPGHHGAAYNMQSARLIQMTSDEYLARYLKGEATGMHP